MKIKQLQELIEKSQRIIFMTGAGVSTLSGIPDYRSKGGLYSNAMAERPEYLLSHTALLSEPDRQYKFMLDNMYFPDAKPNIIHQKIAQLRNLDKAFLITQNVDGLDIKTEAGVKNLIEFHGSLYRIYAVNDHRPDIVDNYLKSNYRADGQLLRPDITLYEEQPQKVDQAIEEIKKADLIIIVGTSFVVYPFAGLINYASANAKILSVNLEKIDASDIEQIIGDAGEIFGSLSFE